MKTLNIHMDDEEYNAIVALKGKNTWREFLAEIAAANS